MNEQGKGHLFMEMKKESHDNIKTLIFSRGDCDLKTFANLRSTIGNPLTSGELFYITLYLLNSMKEL